MCRGSASLGGKQLYSLCVRIEKLLSVYAYFCNGRSFVVVALVVIVELNRT